jgi:hypothetical protein
MVQGTAQMGVRLYTRPRCRRLLILGQFYRAPRCKPNCRSDERPFFQGLPEKPPDRGGVSNPFDIASRSFWVTFCNRAPPHRARAWGHRMSRLAFSASRIFSSVGSSRSTARTGATVNEIMRLAIMPKTMPSRRLRTAPSMPDLPLISRPPRR